MNYTTLAAEYADPSSLGSRKIRLVNRYLPAGGSLLDIGMGTGELIACRIGQHKTIVGIDYDRESVALCREKFDGIRCLRLFHAGIGELRSCPERFDCITCLDLLEHIDEGEVAGALEAIHRLLNENGILIVSGPGIFEKIRIALGRSPDHRHSHSSYGWAAMIGRAGFVVRHVRSVEFPVIDRPFLREHLHIFGKCCVIVAQKKTGGP